ncbi:MAG: hypothetical protein ACR2G0_07635 [Chthoniobacterales bacterium]
MNKLKPAARRHAFWLVCAAVLAGGFCSSLLPVVLGRDMSASEMIAESLPRNRTLQSASQSEFLSAVCLAVRRHRSAAASVTSMAVVARRDLAGEITGTVLRCAGETPCDFVGPVVAAAVAAQGKTETVTAAALAKAPGCAETIRISVKRGTDASERTVREGVTESARTSDAEAAQQDGFDPQEELKIVCDGGTARTVRAGQLAEFLRSHPGSFVGYCPPATPLPPAPSLHPPKPTDF